ncbi:MAG: uroporphyrinogen decarboxylase family protein [Anaerolineae bacterium]|nr:uroporphyrinogen decarboxylase family protein [Anaerolineae bacterium]
MNSRERVMKAINHEEPDRIPIDLGGSIVSGIMAGALVRLRRKLGWDDAVKVYDLFQMLGEVTQDLIERFDIDVLPVEPEALHYAHMKKGNYKPWTLFDGTPVWVPGAFDVEVTSKGDWVLHEDGDPAKKVLGMMPKDGFYFDNRASLSSDPDFKPPSIESLRDSGWLRVKDENLRYMQEQALMLRKHTDKALLCLAHGLGAPSVGSLTDGLMLLVTEPTYIQEMMALGAEIALDNLKLYWEALGNNIDIITISLRDYGVQDREMFSPRLFERYFEPCYKVQCDWVHENTPWKTYQHSCGSIPRLIEPMIRAGIDILNPVQTSAGGMDARYLKQTFGDRITFWGGGVDTQWIASFGTVEEVREDVLERIKTFGPGGGFVWAAIHNIQYNVPPENIIAALDTVREMGKYPLKV